MYVTHIRGKLQKGLRAIVKVTHTWGKLQNGLQAIVKVTHIRGKLQNGLRAIVQQLTHIQGESYRTGYGQL